MDQKKPDPEMLKELELLLNMDALSEESDWEALSEMPEVSENPEEAK